MKILVIGNQERFYKYSIKENYQTEQIIFLPLYASEEEIIKSGKDVEMILVDAMGKISSKVIDSMPYLKLIQVEGVGYQGVDVNYARAKNIYVCNCQGMNAQAVAEHTIMLMLSVLRFLRIDDLNTREGKQIEVKEHHMLIGDLKELGECTIGLIGYGDIGQATAKLLVPFGSKILYYQPSGRNPHDTISEYCPLDQLLAQSDIVSLHLPSNNKTKDMVNDDFFKKMKKGSILINTSRGDIVSSSALLNSLKNGTLFGAGLDCISNEPIRKDNPIFNADQEILDKIIFTPHTAGVTSSSFKRGYATIWHNIHSIENGTKPIHIVWEKK